MLRIVLASHICKGESGLLCDSAGRGSAAGTCIVHGSKDPAVGVGEAVLAGLEIENCVSQLAIFSLGCSDMADEGTCRSGDRIPRKNQKELRADRVPCWSRTGSTHN